MLVKLFPQQLFHLQHVVHQDKYLSLFGFLLLYILSLTVWLISLYLTNIFRPCLSLRNNTQRIILIHFIFCNLYDIHFPLINALSTFYNFFFFFVSKVILIACTRSFRDLSFSYSMWHLCPISCDKNVFSPSSSNVSSRVSTFRKQRMSFTSSSSDSSMTCRVTLKSKRSSFPLSDFWHALQVSTSSHFLRHSGQLL